MISKKYDKYLMYFNTVQGTPIKTLIEALKEVLTDVTIRFDTEGFKIINMDPNQVSFVLLKMLGDKFEEYYCLNPPDNPYIIGVSIASLYKFLKTVGNNDTLTMYVTKDNQDKLEIVIQNKKKRIDNKISYNIIDVDFVEIDIPEIDYDAQITMACSDFQKFIRELLGVSDYVKFGISSTKKFFMSVNGTIGSQTLAIEQSDDSNIVIEINDNIKGTVDIGTFSLKFLNLFCKSSTLCNSIQLYLCQDYPIILVFSVASLGSVKFCLIPKVKDENE